VDTSTLTPPMERAVELAWDSFRAGSLGIGAVITCDGEVVATGRNRLFESDPGDDVLAGSSLAHAELNALAKLPWGRKRDGLELWTTLQPCLQCLGAIRLSPVRRVHVLAPDPLFRGVEAARHLNEFIGRDWPEILELPVESWAVLSLLFPTHVTEFWQAEQPGWNDGVPAIASLARSLVASGELIDLAASSASLPAVAAALGPRLAACLPDVQRLAAVGLGADGPYDPPHS
jgi:tRNA(Arg) A34 adenosine deaminase TadA